VQLGDLQDTTFGGIQEWANKRFKITLATSESLFGCEQHPDVPLAYAEYLNQLPYPQLVAISELAGACKSLLIAFAVHGGYLSVQEVR
jgi:chaperone required for assembly of F1-ATPase